MNTKTIVWIVIAAGVFGFLWYKGYLTRFADYVRETREELRKCSWPTWEELKGSTLLVTVAVGALGIFTVIVDYVFHKAVFLFFQA